MTALILAGQCFKEVLRKKDFYVFLILFFVLLAFFYNESFFSVTTSSRYLKDIGLSLINIFSIVIAVIFSAKQVPSELESKTVYTILAKPVSRSEFVLGKYLGSMSISWFCFTVFYILLILAASLHGEGIPGVLTVQAYILYICQLSLITAMSMFFSLFMTLSANVTISILIFFLVSWYNGMLAAMIRGMNGIGYYFYSFIYYLLPHFEFFDIKIRLVHSWEPLPANILLSVIVYTIMYDLCLLSLTSVIFGKKNL